RRAIAAEKVQQAKAFQEAYMAEKLAEEQRAERERATQKANIVIPAEIAKEKAIIDAEAEAEKIRREAKGQADAIFAKMEAEAKGQTDAIFAKIEAEAKGIYEILTKQAEGYQRIVEAAGGDPSQAVTFLIADKLPELVRTQVEAVKNIKIDKITVWDGNNNANGNTSTSNFISGMMKSVPPLNDLFSMAGLELPAYLKGKSEQNSETTNTEEPNTEEPN